MTSAAHCVDDYDVELSPLVSSAHAAGPNVRALHHKWYRNASLGALVALLFIAAFVNGGFTPAHPNAPTESTVRRQPARPAALVHTNDVVQLNTATDSTEGKVEGEGVDSGNRMKDHKDDKGEVAASDKGANNAGTPTHVPPTMHVVHRDFSKDCAPPLFKCISVQTAHTPAVQHGSALIKVSGSAVNQDDPSEASFYRAYYQNVTLGLDASGIVVAVADGCPAFKVGDHVWSTFPMLTSAFYGSGGLAEYASVVCSYSGIAPSSIDLALAGTLPTDALTSLGALQAAGAPWTSKDFTVLIAAGAGGTGYSAVQLAKIFGATKVVTAAGHKDGVSFVKSLGADIAVDYHRDSVLDAIPDGSVDFVYDNLGGLDAQLVLKKLKPGGIFISIVTPLSARQSPHGIRQMFYYVWSDDQLLKIASNLDILANLIDAGKFKVHVDETYELDKVKDAYSHLLNGSLKARIGIVPKKSDRIISKNT